MSKLLNLNHYNQVTLQDLSLNGDASFNNDVFVSNNLVTNNDIRCNNRLFVLGDASLNNDVYVKETFIVDGDASLNANLRVSNDTNLNKRLFVSGDASLNSDLYIKEMLLVDGDVSLNANLKVSDDATLNDRLFVSNDASFNNDVFISNNLVTNNDIQCNNNLLILGDVSWNPNNLATNCIPSTAVIGGAGGSSAFSANGDDIYFNNGNVGIGTTSPSQKLHIKGNDDEYAVLEFEGRRSSGTRKDRKAFIGVGATGGNWGTDMYFRIRNSADETVTWDTNSQNVLYMNGSTTYLYTGNTERMTINSSGYVGIGTTSPSKLLHIHNPNASTSYLQLTHSTSGTASGSGAQLFLYGADTYLQNTNTSGDIRFRTAGYNDRMIINHLGYVGIGVDPGTTLDVNGIVRTRGTHTSTTEGPYYDSGFYTNYILGGSTGNGTNTLRVGTYNNTKIAITHNYERSLTGQSNYLGGIDFERSGGESGLMRVRGGFVNASGSSFAVSDDRIKHNEKIITDGISIVKQMIPKTYDMTDDMYDASYNGPLDKYKPSAGYIAQDIQAIPDLSFCVIDTSEYDDSGNLVKLHPLALNYTALMPYHTAAIKQQQEQIELDKVKIASLESENATLKTQVTDISTRLSALENN